jgi:5-methyltetrahydrofolate--homocysteine methyltransferase
MFMTCFTSMILPRPPDVEERGPFMDQLSDLREAILAGDAGAAADAARVALDAGVTPVDVIAEGISPAMGEVGKLFEEGEYFVPELLIAARATKEVFAILRPLLAGTGARPAGRVLLATVEGDLHDIGKNLVGAMLEGAGFEVVDLGVDIPASRFVSAVEEARPQIVGLSALLTTTMPAMKATLEALDAAGLRPEVRVMVGGAPVTQRYADSIGADGYGDTATAAVELARRLIDRGSGDESGVAG